MEPDEWEATCLEESIDQPALFSTFQSFINCRCDASEWSEDEFIETQISNESHVISQ